MTISTNERTNERTNAVHCLFEQSGTFKREFIKLGITAYDYDILDDYGETDFKIDLFAEIESAYDGKASVFDNFKAGDLLMAFFPCVRFENQVMLHFRGQSHWMEKWTYKQKMRNCMKLLSELKYPVIKEYPKGDETHYDINNPKPVNPIQIIKAEGIFVEQNGEIPRH